MSNAVRIANQSRTAPPPTSATVLDFICLFTHDLKRKQKRWQDGKVKFHTFNKRYMVYDDRGNFIGDGHWQDAADEFEEGVELELDRGSAIVQVSECTGSREQDLTDIIDKRAREVEKRRANASTAARTPVASNRSVRHDVGASSLRSNQPLHRPLTDIVPSAGPIGRASISDRSPFENRKSLFEHEVQKRAPPAKKRRVDDSPPSKMGHAQSLFGTRLTLSIGSVPYSSRRPNTLQSKPQADEEKREKVMTTMERSPSPVVQVQPRVSAKLPSLPSGDTFETKSPYFETRREAETSTKLKKTPQTWESEMETIPSSSQYGGAKHQKGKGDNEIVKVKEENPLEVISIESTPEPDVKPRTMVNKPMTSLLRKPPTEREKDATKKSVATVTTEPELPKRAERTLELGSEQRTELRIKPRQRRGLVMLSEKKANSEQVYESGPQITNMPRKSVKSKEIFGFVVPDADLIPASFISMANGPVTESEPVAPPPVVKAVTSVGFESARALTVMDKMGGNSENAQARDVAPPEAKPKATSAPKPRIANPATRGKKAARKEDAAGQVPQCVVPFDPVVIRPRIVYTNVIGSKVSTSTSAKTANTTSANSNSFTNAAGKPIATANLPGFSKASSGAWTRHAEDLLGMTRPLEEL